MPQTPLKPGTAAALPLPDTAVAPVVRPPSPAKPLAPATATPRPLPYPAPRPAAPAPFPDEVDVELVLDPGPIVLQAPPEVKIVKVKDERGLL
jgi:hypothetical protein